MAKGPQVGDPAPDFELPGTEGNFRLSDHRGRRVVLLFYPGDETPGCTKQFCSYRDDSEKIDALDATVVGISGQDLESHNSFVENHRLTVALLADSGRAVAGDYGLAAPVIGTRRAVVIVDEEGIVRYRKAHLVGIGHQSADQLAEALASTGAPA